MRNERLDKLQYLYSKLYEWHKTIGVQKYYQKYGNKICGKESIDDEYLILVEMLPAPEKSELSIIKKVAHETLTGCMEWSFNEKYLNEEPLYSIARHIKNIIDESNEDNSDQVQREKLLALSNTVGNKGEIIPAYVDININHDQMSIEKYQEYSILAYSDVPDKSDNLGGKVALSDTNLELEHQHGVKNDSNNHILRFRNSKAMHFKEIEDPESITNLVQSEIISVLSVKIGG